MNFFLQKAKATYNILCHLWNNRVVITNPLPCSRLFMERTRDDYKTTLRFGGLRFLARKEDMNAVTEVLVGGGYDTVLPYLKSIPHPPVILDCGANIGSFGLRVLRERPDARIVSVEAAGDTYAILAHNQKANPGNWDTVHAAIWRNDGHLVLSRSVNSVMHTVREAEAGENASIPARSIASIRQEFSLSRLDILKMDIEGAETSVIPACIEDMDAGMIIIEVHKMLGDPRECCELLAGKYPYAFVLPDQLDDASLPNVVYYLYKEKVDGAGMMAVDLMQHLRSVYVPEMWNEAR
ncbi:MAG: FkbM family methyltransferase [Desulfovibrionaceae bacterium]